MQVLPVSDRVLRNVATLPILSELAQGSQYVNELIRSLEGLAAPRTVSEGLRILEIEGLIECVPERTRRTRKRCSLSPAGLVIAQASLSKIQFVSAFGHGARPSANTSAQRPVYGAAHGQPPAGTESASKTSKVNV